MTKAIIEIEKCVKCPYHKVVADPDPNDWFNDDDEAIVCTKVSQEPDQNSKYQSDKQSHKTIEGSLRPYQTKNVEVPNWCPLKK